MSSHSKFSRLPRDKENVVDREHKGAPRSPPVRDCAGVPSTLPFPQGPALGGAADEDYGRYRRLRGELLDVGDGTADFDEFPLESPNNVVALTELCLELAPLFCRAALEFAVLRGALVELHILARLCVVLGREHESVPFFMTFCCRVTPTRHLGILHDVLRHLEQKFSLEEK